MASQFVTGAPGMRNAGRSSSPFFTRRKKARCVIRIIVQVPAMPMPARFMMMLKASSGNSAFSSTPTKPNAEVMTMPP